METQVALMHLENGSLLNITYELGACVPFCSSFFRLGSYNITHKQPQTVEEVQKIRNWNEDEEGGKVFWGKFKALQNHSLQPLQHHNSFIALKLRISKNHHAYINSFIRAHPVRNGRRKTDPGLPEIGSNGKLQVWEGLMEQQACVFI